MASARQLRRSEDRTLSRLAFTSGCEEAYGPSATSVGRAVEFNDRSNNNEANTFVTRDKQDLFVSMVQVHSYGDDLVRWCGPGCLPRGLRAWAGEAGDANPNVPLEDRASALRLVCEALGDLRPYRWRSSL